MSDKLVQKITSNWELLKGLVSRIEDAEKRHALLSLCDKVADRAIVCPASTRTEYVGCFTGGLVWHSLNVVKIMKELVKLYDLDVDTDSLIIAGVFHDFGKLGTMDKDYYLSQHSDWHRSKGMLYEINPEVSGHTVQALSLYWINQYGCPLSEDEVSAILSLSTKFNETISYVPSFKDPWLSVILQHAVRIACMKNNGITSLI